MAKEKKRGFFSWLGFGQKEQPEESQVETQGVISPTEPEVEAADVAQQASATPIEQPETVSAEQAADSPLPQDETSQTSTVSENVDVHEVESLPQDTVAAAVDEDSYQAHQADVVTEEVAAIESIISHADTKTAHQAAPVDPSAETDPLAVAVQEQIVTEEVATIESRVSDTAVEESHAEPPLVTDAEPVIVPLVAESSLEEPKAELPAEVAAEPVIEPLVAESPLEIPQHEESAEPVVATILEQEKPTREGFFARLKRSLVKTKQNLGSGFMGLFRGKKIDDDLFEELEEQLLIADVGVDTTQKIISKLTETASRKQLRDAESLYILLKEEMSEILTKVDAPLKVEGKIPFVILMIGVNGVGKTTTIGKLARQFELEGKSVMLAAGDTFRAAAVEQLQVWGDRNNIPVIAQHTGADSASVIFDAIQAAKARNIDVLIADTAGRLQNKAHLMEELKKIVRVMKKLDEEAPHEIMLTLDASTGQNAISQAKLFHEAVGITGITLTKLDGTAKGGVIFSIADQFGIPIRYIGVGEQLADLRPFSAEDFIEALFARED